MVIDIDEKRNEAILIGELIFNQQTAEEEFDIERVGWLLLIEDPGGYLELLPLVIEARLNRAHHFNGRWSAVERTLSVAE